MRRTVQRSPPPIVAVAPLPALAGGATHASAGHLLLRLIDRLKASGISGVYTAPHPVQGEVSEGALLISSVIDSWLALRDREEGGERSRELSIVKSRGTAHSRRVHGFTIGDLGIEVENGRKEKER
jgi:circadian clock protein KaiC